MSGTQTLPLAASNSPDAPRAAVDGGAWHVSAVAWKTGGYDEKTLPRERQVLIGRAGRVASSTALGVDDPHVSERHLIITRDERGAVHATPVRTATNPVFLNGRAITEQTELPAAGALLKVGLSFVVVSPRPNTVLGVVCRSGLMREALHDVMKVAGTAGLSILLDGETGSGKTQIAQIVAAVATPGRPPLVTILSEEPAEMVAPAIFGHTRNFVPGVPERDGAIEAAGDGVLFLDEIGELPLHDQARLLRPIRERKYHRLGENVARDVRCRFVFATNRDLNAEVAAGRFRKDLLHRIRGLHVSLPPLRARREDLPYLVEHFLEGAAERPSDAAHREVVAALGERSWEGNIGELAQVVHLARALGSFHEALGIAHREVPAPTPAPASMPTLDPRSLADVRPWSDVAKDLERVYTARVAALGVALEKRRETADAFGLKEESFKRALKRLQLDGTGW